MAKTHGKVVGVNGTRDVIATREGSIFTEVSASSGSDRAFREGNTGTVSIKADGSGRFTLKRDGMLITEIVWGPAAQIKFPEQEPFRHAYYHPGPQDCRDSKQCHERAYA